jgi:tetratricopeptide (TPR) repeat protein
MQQAAQNLARDALGERKQRKRERDMMITHISTGGTMSKILFAIGACVTTVLLSLAGTAVQTPSTPATSPRRPIQGNVPSTIAAPPATNAPTTDQRVAVLEERMNTAIALKEEKIQDLKERIDNIYKFVAFFGTAATILIALLSVRDILLRTREGARQRSIDEIVKAAMNQQLTLGAIQLQAAEKEGQRQAGLDKIVTEMLGVQSDAMKQQFRLGSIQLDAALADPVKHLERVKNVSDVIDTVQKTLAFRLEQEKKVAEAIQKVERLEAERDRKDKQKLESALSILDTFKTTSRMQFASLTAEQHQRAIKLVEKVSDLKDFLNDQRSEVAGNLLCTCGTITYYDNDIIEARAYFDAAAQCRAADHDAELRTNEAYRNRFAFIHYFRALIQKNWGDLHEALYEIEQSARLLESRTTEFLTPTTKAEILSYNLGDEQRCRSELVRLLERITVLEDEKIKQGGKLDSNQRRLRNRMLILLGNTHYVAAEFAAALEQYEKALNFNPHDYYAMASAAQCHRNLGALKAAEDASSGCLAAIERSGDFNRKRERITRAVIAVLAANAAKGCGNGASSEHWANEARDLLEGDLAVDGLSPKFFSPSTKRLVSSTELLREVDLIPIAGTSTKAA